MQFQVPQFIEVEDKIVGPLTFRQFIYLAGTAGALVVLYQFLPLFLTVLLGAPLLVLGLALAFYKVNNRPFIYALEAGITYLRSHKLYLWKHEQKNLPQKAQVAQGEVPLPIPRLSQNRLKDIAWSLDIQESIYSKREQK